LPATRACRSSARAQRRGKSPDLAGRGVDAIDHRALRDQDDRILEHVLAFGHGFCALLSGGTIRCWGDGQVGKLGYANTNSIGDNEVPSSVGVVDVGGTATAITAGASHTCALLSDNTVRCWGRADVGQLGYGNTNTIGDNETPAAAGAVPVGGSVLAIGAGGDFTCALLVGGGVRCWGWGMGGRLGYANTNNIGDNETPAAVGNVSIGGPVAGIGVAAEHVCAVLVGGAVRCWGSGDLGRLGYGNITTIGDNETPASAGDVQVY